MSSKLREKFVDHMELYGLSKFTQKGYITGVKGLAKHYNQSPETLTDDQVRAYFRHLLSCIDNLKHRVLLKTIYSAGLRVGETIRLKPEHIESDPSRMVIRVAQGKGSKDRYTVLSEKLLHELREYWLKYSPKHWLFPGKVKLWQCL